MSTPQSRDLARNGHSPADPGSTKTALTTDESNTGGGGRRGRVPEANRPGHHPDHEQDKPVDAFVAKAAALAAGHDHDDAPQHAGEGAHADERADTDEPDRSSEHDHTEQHDRTDAPEPVGSAAGAPTGSGPTGVQAGGSPSGLSMLRLDVAVPAVALVDAARHAGDAWDEIGESRTAWLARIGLLGPVGAWRYTTSVRPRLEAAQRARRLAGA